MTGFVVNRFALLPAFGSGIRVTDIRCYLYKNAVLVPTSPSNLGFLMEYLKLSEDQKFPSWLNDDSIMTYSHGFILYSDGSGYEIRSTGPINERNESTYLRHPCAWGEGFILTTAQSNKVGFFTAFSHQNVQTFEEFVSVSSKLSTIYTEISETYAIDLASAFEQTDENSSSKELIWCKMQEQHAPVQNEQIQL